MYFGRLRGDGERVWVSCSRDQVDVRARDVNMPRPDIQRLKHTHPARTVRVLTATRRRGERIRNADAAIWKKTVRVESPWWTVTTPEIQTWTNVGNSSLFGNSKERNQILCRTRKQQIQRRILLGSAGLYLEFLERICVKVCYSFPEKSFWCLSGIVLKWKKIL